MPDRDAYPVLPGALADKPTLSLTDRLRGKRLRCPGRSRTRRSTSRF